MPGVRSIAMKSIRTTILLFILGKIVLNENYVEFDFSIGHALVLSPFF